jgi:hypothetical protein
MEDCAMTKKLETEASWAQVCRFGAALEQLSDAENQGCLALAANRADDFTTPILSQVQACARKRGRGNGNNLVFFTEDQFTVISWRAPYDGTAVTATRQSDGRWLLTYEGARTTQRPYFRAYVGACPEALPLSGLGLQLMLGAGEIVRNRKGRNRTIQEWVNALVAAPDEEAALAALPPAVVEQLRAWPEGLLGQALAALKRRKA